MHVHNNTVMEQTALPESPLFFEHQTFLKKCVIEFGFFLQILFYIRKIKRII